MRARVGGYYSGSSTASTGPGDMLFRTERDEPRGKADRFGTGTLRQRGTKALTHARSIRCVCRIDINSQGMIRRASPSSDALRKDLTSYDRGGAMALFKTRGVPPPPPVRQGVATIPVDS